MTDNHILITSDGELAVPFEALSVEHDPGRHLSTYTLPAGEFALPVVVLLIVVGVTVGGQAGIWIVLSSFVIVPVVWSSFNSLKIEVYETGMKISGWNRRTYWILWDEITEIEHLKEERWMGGLDRINKTYMELSLYIRNERVFVLPRDIPNRAGLYYLIVRHVEKSLLEYYRRILPEGKAIAMGPIRIEMAGVHVHDDFLKWADIESFERDKDVFTLRTSQQTYRLTFKRNQDVLQRLFANAMSGDIGADKDFQNRTDYVYSGSQIVVKYDLK